MAKYPPGVLTDEELSHLLRGPQLAMNSGPIVWTVKGGKLEGRLPVSTPLDGPGGVGEVRFAVVSMRADSPGVVYLVSGVPVARFDINGKHNGWERCSHVHHYRPSGDETTSVNDLGVVLDRGTHPGSAEFRGIIEAFAGFVQVDLQEGWWTPWERRWEPWTR